MRALVLLAVFVGTARGICLPNGTVIMGDTKVRVAAGAQVVAEACGRSLQDLQTLAASATVPGTQLRDLADVTAPLQNEARLGYGVVVERDAGQNATYRLRARPALPQRAAQPSDTELATRTLLSPDVGSQGRVELVRTTHGLYGEAWVLWVHAYEREVALSLHRCLSHRCHETEEVYAHAETLADANGQFVGAELLLVDQTVWVMWMHASTTGPVSWTLETVRCESETTCAAPTTTTVALPDDLCSEVQQAGVVQDALSVVRNTAAELMVLFACPLPATSRPGVRAFFCPIASTCATGSVTTTVHAPDAATAPPAGTDAVWLEALLNPDTSTPEMYWAMWQESAARSQLFLVRCGASDCAAANTTAKLAGDDTFSQEKIAPLAVEHAESGALLAVYARTYFVLSGSDATPGVGDVQLFASTSLDPNTDATLGQNVVGFDSGAYNGLYTRDAGGANPQLYGVYALRRDRQGRPVLLYNDQQNVLRMRLLATANGDDATVDELVEVGVSAVKAADADEPVLAADLGLNVDGEPLVFYARLQSNATLTVGLHVVHAPQPHLFVD